jgi:hypothetical protein
MHEIYAILMKYFTGKLLAFVVGECKLYLGSACRGGEEPVAKIGPRQRCECCDVLIHLSETEQEISSERS